MSFKWIILHIPSILKVTEYSQSTPNKGLCPWAKPYVYEDQVIWLWKFRGRIDDSTSSLRNKKTLACCPGDGTFPLFVHAKAREIYCILKSDLVALKRYYIWIPSSNWIYNGLHYSFTLIIITLETIPSGCLKKGLHCSHSLGSYSVTARPGNKCECI